MASFSRFARRTPFPAAATFIYHTQLSACEAERPAHDDTAELEKVHKNETAAEPMKPNAGMRAWEEGDFHGLFPKRQLWQPAVEYPLWDNNWDGKMPPTTGDKEADHEMMKRIRKTGVTRHVILIRHGQYDETHKEDEKRLLTDLGKSQADLTGKRLAEMIQGIDEKFGPCKIKVIRVSNLVRAKETADIIANHLPGVERAEPDPLLNEARPAHTIPGGRAHSSIVKKMDEGHSKAEEAFRKYFFRATERDGDREGNESDDESKSLHEFEIIVGHANIIRYFLCRALQLPPEAWLRLCTFNCSLTYLTIRPTGTVSCRMLGDIGHLPYGMSTFSRHAGYNW